MRGSLSLDTELVKKGGKIDEFGRLVTSPSPSPSPSPSTPSVSKRNSLSYFDSTHPYISSSFSPSSFFPSAEKILLENKIKRSEEEIQ